MTTDGEAGFTVLETIVAMTILALMLAIATQSIVLASRSVASARNQAEAAFQLRAQLASFEAIGTSTGDSDTASPDMGTDWRLQEIDIGGRKMIAIQTSGQVHQNGPSFLTFIPSRK